MPRPWTATPRAALCLGYDAPPGGAAVDAPGAARGNPLAGERAAPPVENTIAALTAFPIGLSLLWNSIHPLLLPILLAGLVAPGLQNTALSTLTFVGLVVAMVTQPLAGALSDRARLPFGRRHPLIALGALLSVVILGAMALFGPTSLVALAGLYTLLQVTMNVALAAHQALIPDLVPAHRRGIAGGARSFGDILGIIVGTLVVTTMVEQGGVAAGIGATALGLFLAAGATLIWVREGWGGLPTPVATVGAGRWFDPGAFRLGKNAPPEFRRALVGRLLFVVAMTSVQSFAFNFIRDVLDVGEPLEVYRGMVTGIGVAILVACLPAGAMFDRFGHRIPTLVASALGAVGCALMITAADAAAVTAYGVLVGAGMGLFIASNWALLTRIVPTAEAARYMGLTNLATAGGAALARFNGPLIDGINSVVADLGYRVMLAEAALLFLGGGVVLATVRAVRSR